MLKYAAGFALALCALNAAAADNPAVTVAIDVTVNRHAINPMIYGVSFGTPADLKALNAPLNRSGGNTTTTYNWRLNASNHDAEYFFESLPDDNSAAADAIKHLASVTWSGGKLTATVPSQSITLFVLPQ